MLEIFILGFIVPSITICFLFCKYYFFRIYVTSLEHQFGASVIFYFFLGTFYFVVGSISYFYLGLICFQYVVGITAFFIDGRYRGYIAFALIPPIQILLELVSGVYSMETIQYVFIVMLISILFCELISFLNDIDLFVKYATSLVVINIISPVLVGYQWKSSFILDSNTIDIHLPVVFGSIIILWFVYRYSSELQSKEVHISELKYEATYDGLTDLMNYSSFSNYLTHYKGNLKAYHHIVVMLDIDNFKYINDNYGHLEGNNVIRFFSTTLKRFFKRSLFKNVEIYRFGGEEFSILFKDQNIDDCFKVMLNFQEKLSTKKFLTDKQKIINVTFSGGIAETNEFNEIDKAVKQADRALYLAKKAGRGQIVCPTCKI